MARILVIEDEPAILRGLVDLLAYHGHQPTPCEHGTDGLELALAQDWELVLVDVMLPGTDGFTITEQLRAAKPQQGILMLTAKGQEADVLEGFQRGCDDYVTKPFSIAQLMARVDALLRRSARPVETLELSGVTVDVDNLEAHHDGRSVRLSVRDVELLGYFATHRDRIVSRAELLTHVWGYARVDGVETRAIDMHLVKLRRKLARIIDDELIETVRGAGYRLC